MPKKTPGTSLRLLRILSAQPQPLFALLDSARTPRILEILEEIPENWLSLYEGDGGKEYDTVAPYLVGGLLRQPSLVRILIEEGWGKSWGIYLTSEEEFMKVRRHLRRFLVVQDEGRQHLYFRFYDPRVLRVFLPTCSNQQIVEFFGPVSSFLFEAENSKYLIRSSRSSGEFVEDHYNLKES